MDDVDRAQELLDRLDALRADERAARGIPGPHISPWTHCASCGDEIPAERRISVPTTRRCSECQGEFESLCERGLL